MPELLPSDKVERIVQAALDVPEPTARFLSELGDRLETRARYLAQNRPTSRARSRLFRRPVWQIALVLALVVLMVVLGIGPQRVLAQVERLLGYIPGVGFIDLNGPMILAGPVTLQRGDVAVHVDQAVATSEGTLVQFSITLPQGASPEKLPVDKELQFTPKILLEGKTELNNTGTFLGLSGGQIEFPALPKGTRQVTLILNCLPLLFNGCLPGEWRFVLQFTPATQKQFSGFLSQPYDPRVEATANGVTMRVQQVVHSSDETAIQLESEWANSTWSWMGGGDPHNYALSDDSGYPYETKDVNLGGLTSLGFVQVTTVPPRSPEDTPTGQIMTQVETFTSAPLSGAARHLTFSVDWVHFQVPAGGEFSLDLGPAPYVGETWTLDQTLNVAGFNVRLVGARLMGYLEPGDSGGQGGIYWVDFIFRAAQQSDRWLEYFEAEPVSGSQASATSRQGEAGGYSHGIRLGFGTQVLPQGRQVYRINQAEVALRGPWRFAWPIPGASLRPRGVREAVPQAAVQEQNGLLLKLAAAQASDRWSQVQVTAPSLQPGDRLLYVLGWNPLAQPEPAQPDLYLLDDHGHRQEVSGGIQPLFSPERYDPARLEFAPVPAEANHLFLHVPAVEVEIPASAVFTVTVPDGLSFSEPGNLAPNTRTVSNAWPVDLRLDIAGYSIHFNQAYVEQDDLLNPGGAYQLVVTGTPLIERQAGCVLRELRVSSIGRPDGGTWSIEGLPRSPDFEMPPTLQVAPASAGASDLAATLRVDVTAGNGVDVLPGTYEIALDRANVIAPGPWNLSFSLPGR